MRVLIAPDKLRGTLSARAAAQALSEGLVAAGVETICLPLSDGGEGFLDALGGPNRTSEVRNAFGIPAVAPWRLSGARATIESAIVIGYVPGVIPDPAGAEAASSYGLGELVAEALRAGVRQVNIGLGGSATTDGGAGALEALEGLLPFDPGCAIVLATDVTTRYLAAAGVFGPQKGADPAAVVRLERRLAVQAELLRARFARDVNVVAGAGAAGGLAGGLWAAGASIVPGFDFVAALVGLESQVAAADLVVTAEGRLDRTSFTGKVVGGVLAAAGRAGVRAVVVAGQADRETIRGSPAPVIDLSERFGDKRSIEATADCLRQAAPLVLAAWL
ncbi:MAG TPA: glycerate kinase [Acidimicrobiales bacterium]|nr:glycerate kinase [Acidimicrobiales bacterium]